jgi:Zn-finger nucleic acid-binding protein
MNGILTVDICSMSAGIWLDYLEIQKLRELYPKESDRKKSVEDFVENSFQLKNEDQKHSVLGLSKLIFNLSK